MKKSIIFTLTAVLACSAIFTLAACEKDKTATATLPANAALLLPYAEEDADAQSGIIIKLVSAFNSYAQQSELAVTPYYATDANAQPAQIDAAINAETGVIVIIPAAGADFTEGLKAAKSAGIPVVTLHTNIANADLIDAYVGSDYLGAVSLLMESAETAHSGETIAVINGPVGDPTADAIASDLDKNSSAIIANSDWTSDGAKKTTDTLIAENENLGAIISANASMASGAAKAIKAKKLAGKISVYALSPSGLNEDFITSGKVATAAIPDVDTEAKTAADICKLLINHKAPEMNTLVPFIIIEKENIEEYLDAKSESAELADMPDSADKNQ
jgi:ABC-type sugar transport system substrate-binding protein